MRQRINMNNLRNTPSYRFLATPYSSKAACSVALMAMLIMIGVSATHAELAALKPQGTQFLDNAGQPVRLWGVNLCALYPTHEQSTQIAKDLAERGVNVVRPHHMLRRSRDWVSDEQITSLVDHVTTTRKFNSKALDRFDFLHAQLREQGIYSMFAGRWSRSYLPADVDIIKTDDADAQAWSAAMQELNQRHWRKAIDARKLLPMIDDRVAALDVEFIKNLLTHVNPYTGKRYADDAQVVSVEMINEASSEYTLICGNDLPTYWQDQLVKKWDAFAQAQGLATGGDLYRPQSNEHKAVRARFFDQLDRVYMKRMTEAVREVGYGGAVTLSNLWRGEMALKRHDDLASYIEDHMYADPRVVANMKDLFYTKSQSALIDKPFIIGEFNQAEGHKNIAEQSNYRTMLMLASAAYGSLHDWSGFVWFSWTHGDRSIDQAGHAINPDRQSHLGNMMRDTMMQDHLRTAGMIFRRGLVKTSRKPITLYVEEPYWAADYHGVVRPKVSPQHGWQNIHGIRKVFAKAPDDQSSLPWFTEQPASPLVSDTGEIVKNLATRQLKLIAPQAEGFSGWLSTDQDVIINHLSIEAMDGFATIMIVAADDKPIATSRKLIISRTAIDPSGDELTELKLTLQGLTPKTSPGSWQVTVTRPDASAQNAEDTNHVQPSGNQPGIVTLPGTGWHECEIEWK